MSESIMEVSFADAMALSGATKLPKLELRELNFPENQGSRFADAFEIYRQLDSLVPPAAPEPGPLNVSYDALEDIAKKSFQTPMPPIIGYKAVALWYYEGCEDDCVICMQRLMKLCNTCENSASDCDILVGECGHPIHEHCFANYTRQDSCLICTKPWRVRTRLPLN